MRLAVALTQVGSRLLFFLGGRGLLWELDQDKLTALLVFALQLMERLASRA